MTLNIFEKVNIEEIKRYFERLQETYTRLLSSEKTRPLFLMIVGSIGLIFIILPLFLILSSSPSTAIPVKKAIVGKVAKKKKPAEASVNENQNQNSQVAKMKKIYRKIQLAEVEEAFLKRRVSVEKMRKELGTKGNSLFAEEEEELNSPNIGTSSTTGKALKKYKKGEQHKYEVLLVFSDQSNNESTATITDGVETTDVHPGDILVDKTKVVAITPDTVIFEYRNKLFKKEVS